MYPLIAHRNEHGEQPLIDHLKGVADLARAFSQKFGAGELGYLCGILHDIGKADPKFQDFIRRPKDAKGKHVGGHAYPGAAAAAEILGDLAPIIMGHHAGMPNWDGPDSLVKEAMHLTAFEPAREFLSRSLDLDLPSAKWPRWAAPDTVQREVLIRMVFSALIDADRLDSEAFDQPDARDFRGAFQPISEYAGQLRAHMSEKATQIRERGLEGTTTNQIRAEVLEACRTAAMETPGFFTLTVPTGGGKTLSGLSFAFEHAAQHGLDRVIVAIPYTSIIEQTAQVCRETFGEDALLDHHSALMPREFGSDKDIADAAAQESSGRRQANAAQNWDESLIITTTVQLFESLFSNRPAACRKLHNIARSVIILDEVQTLPPCRLGPILNCLWLLVTHFGCSVVMCTATQPDFDPIWEALGKDVKAKEIVPNYQDHFAALRRVEFTFPEETWSKDRLADEIRSRDQVLAILNTRGEAVELTRMLEDVPGVMHLSTNLCGFDRRRILAEARDRLRSGDTIRLISTQVVEAGVDVDFPTVLRAFGPLDRVIQAAGRCNREGLRETLGEVIVFKLEEGKAPGGAYKTGIDATHGVVDDQTLQPFDSEAAGRAYWRMYFSRTNTGTERNDILTMQRLLRFSQVAAEFKMIDEISESILVPHRALPDYVNRLSPGLIDESADARAAIDTLWDRTSPRRWFRVLQPFMVTVPREKLAELVRTGVVEMHESGMPVLVFAEGQYSEETGLNLGAVEPGALVF
ncbi:MAG: CRISPR-associated helicase Cas3' [Armatimonadetes bacterium]|nr:CRISPR-associated helicase Cas3' [Armatimonadota bacterium]